MKNENGLLIGECDLCGADVDAHEEDEDCRCQNCGTPYVPVDEDKDLWVEDK
jgi:Zn finger protein HypA/HybF involved in hydrogenase expression